MDWLLKVLASGAGVALVAGVFKLMENRQALNIISKNKRRSDIDVLNAAIRVILHDRIKYLVRQHMNKGEVSFDDRRDVIEMYKIYHDELGGNGNLTALLDTYKKLPIK